MNAIAQTQPAAAPFNLKKTQVKGQCQAMRCTNACTDLLCDRHLKAWQDAGSPALTKAAAAAPKAVPGALSAEEAAALTLAKEQSVVALERAQSFPVETEAQREMAAKVINMAKEMARKFDDRRKELKKPVLELGRMIDAGFKEVIDTYEAIDKTISGRISDHMIALERARRAALAEVAANPAAAAPEAYAAAHAVIEAPKASGGMRARYGYNIKDVNAIPECIPGTEVCLWKRVLDHDVIQGIILNAEAQGVEPVLPGIEFTKTYTVVKG